jgi:hypothetical protein
VFAQPKKWPGVVAAIVITLMLVKNPTGAAHLVNQTFSAIDRFASSLNVGV